MGETSKNNIEIIAELNQIPTDMFAPRTRLTHAHTGDDTEVYSIREYIPHPIDGIPERYVSGRGIDLTEDELKLVCINLREHMCALREFADMDEDELMEMFDGKDIFDDDDTEDNDDDDIGVVCNINSGSFDESNVPCDNKLGPDIDPVDMPDFMEDMNCEYLDDIAEFNDKKITIMSWRNERPKYDIRVWTNKVNSRGYIESTPEIDKGVNIDDYQAELLCQAVEGLFHDLAEDLAEYRTDDWERTTDTIQVELSEKERKILLGAIAIDVDNISNCMDEWNERGSTKGNELAIRHIWRMVDLSNKVKVHDRFSDRDLISCCSLLSTVSGFVHEPDPEHTYKKMFTGMSLNEIYDSLIFLSKKFINILEKREPTEDFSEMAGESVKVDASKSEFMCAAEVFELLQDAIYGRGNTSDELKEIGSAIDKLISEETAGRMELEERDYAESQTPGNDFFSDLITAFVLTAED